MSGSSRQVVHVVHVANESVEVRFDDAGRAWIGEQAYTVVESSDGRLRVQAEGQSEQVVLSIAGKPRPTEASVAGLRVELSVQSASEAALEAAMGGGRGGAGDGQLRAPMPGRIVKVLVAPGDEIEADRPVVIVEAMKMENELVAPCAGVVREVAVEVGAAVESGSVLLVVTPNED